MREEQQELGVKDYASLSWQQFYRRQHCFCAARFIDFAESEFFELLCPMLLLTRRLRLIKGLNSVPMNDTKRIQRFTVPSSHGKACVFKIHIGNSAMPVRIFPFFLSTVDFVPVHHIPSLDNKKDGRADVGSGRATSSHLTSIDALRKLFVRTGSG